MKIAIIGLGYVGLPLGLRFADSGVSVLGLDVDQQKVDAINAGETYIRHIDAADIATARNSGLLEASTDFARVAEVDAILICVPTPLNKYREPDISYVLKSGEAIAPYLRPQVSGSRLKPQPEQSSSSSSQRPIQAPRTPTYSKSSKLALVSKQASTFISRSPLSAKIQAAKITPLKPSRKSWAG